MVSALAVALLWAAVVLALAVALGRVLRAEAPGPLRRRRVRGRLAWAGFAGLALLAVPLPYNARVLAGVPEDAVVVTKHVSYSKLTRRVLVVDTQAVGRTEVLAPRSLHDAAARGQRIAVVAVPGAEWATQLGERATLHASALGWLLGLVLLALAQLGVLPWRFTDDESA
jgi:hypothetical protein